MLFTIVQGAQCVLKCKGVYKQVDVYQRGDRLFAKWAGGFIGLKAHNGGTTKPDVVWEALEGIPFEEVGFDLVAERKIGRVA